MFKSVLIIKQDKKQNTFIQHFASKKTTIKSYTALSIQKKATFQINYPIK